MPACRVVLRLLFFTLLAVTSRSDTNGLDEATYDEQLSWTVESDDDIRAFADLMSGELMTLVPPGASLLERCYVEPLPVQCEKLTFLSSATWADEYTVPTAWIGFFEDEDGVVRVIDQGGWGNELASLPAPPGHVPLCIRLGWPGSLLLQVRCVDVADLADYMYARQVLEQYAAAESEEEEENGGGYSLLLGGSDSNIVFTEIRKYTNRISMTIAYPDAFTNRLDVFTCNDLIPRIWSIAVRELSTSGTNQIAWIDTNSWLFLGPSVRFYSAANADLDSDGDGYPDEREIMVYMTDPSAATSHPVRVSGSISYVGIETGTVEVIFTTESNSWSLAKSTALSAPKAYTNDEIANNQSYWFKSFRDVNTNFVREEWEPWGIYSNTAKLVTGNLSGVNITLQDVPSIWGVIDFAGSQTGDIHVIAVTSSNSWDATYQCGLAWSTASGLGDEEWTYASFPIEYNIQGLPASNYWIKAFMDVDTNGLASSLDPVGQYSSTLIGVSNRVTGVNFDLAYDTDGDGFSDFAEMSIYGTSITVSNPAISVRGTNIYTGTATNGTIWTLLSTTRFAWATNVGSSRTGSGAFAITNVPGNATYWLKTFMDLNSNGRWDGSDVPGLYAPSRLVLTNLSVSNLTLKVSKPRGMRVDFGYYYNGYWTNWSGKSAEQIAGLIVSNASDWGVNTIYARAYYPGGTYWPNPTTQYLTNEGSHGKAGILTQVVARAHAAGIKVMAWCQPLNAFLPAWTANPSWRYKDVATNDWQPGEGWLSPYNTNVMNWLELVAKEVMNQGVDGIDVSETYYDSYNSNPAVLATYDEASRSNFFARFPGGTLGDSNWFQLRRDTLTSNLYGRIGQVVVSSGKEFHVTFTWDANGTTGDIVPEDTYGNQTGFSYDDILDLPEDRRPDIVIPEFIWQSEADEDSYPSIFNPEWTIKMATQYVAFVNGRTLPGIHPEITRNTTVGTNKLPSLPQFENTLRYATTNTSGCDFFIHSLAITNNYLQNGTNGVSFGYAAVSNAFRGTE